MQHKLDQFLTLLWDTYPMISPPLDHRDPYTLLIAVLLSAQCTDNKVNEVTPILFKEASTPEEMIRLSPQFIQSIIRPCGLSPKKAKAIHELSKILLDKHESIVPRTFEELEALPGVGHKTASVVLAQAYGIPTFPVDTHIHRCAKRWGLSTGRNVLDTEEHLKSLFDQSLWNGLHIRIIFWAREFCSARKCYGLECKICKLFFPNRKIRVENPQ